MKAMVIGLVAVVISGCSPGHSGIPQSWAGVHDGMTRQQVYTAIGYPKWEQPEEDHADGSRILVCDYWGHMVSSHKYASLSVSYGSDGRVVSVGHGIGDVVSVNH